MSTQRLAMVTALATHNWMRNGSDADRLNRSYYDRQERPNGTQFHGNVNYLLGGAMLSVMLTLVCFICYCCHRNMRKRSEAVYRQRWLEAEANMEIYSVAQCFDHTADLREMHQQNSSPVTSTNSTAITHGPPPSYDAVVAMDQELDGCDKCAKRRMRRLAPTSAVLCSCPLHKFEPQDETTHQILNVGNLSHGRHSLVQHQVHCGHSPELEVTSTACHSCESPTDYVRTSSSGRSCVGCHVDTDNNEVCSSNQRRQSSQSATSNDATTSSTDNHPDGTCDQNGNFREIIPQDEIGGNSIVELSSINNNGLIRVDMSQIIDRTGLPTYEAALKLESSGYV